MRQSIRRLAAPVTSSSLLPNTAAGTSSLTAAQQSKLALTLIPPIPLYRRLLRIHRKKLDPEQRVFGDSYLKAEFRRHKDVENPLHIVGFLTQWQLYGQELEGDGWKERKVDTDMLDKMNDQQIGQVWELFQAIKRRADGLNEDEVAELEATGKLGKKR